MHVDSSTTLGCLECWIVCTAPTRCSVLRLPISVTWCCLALYLSLFSFLTTQNNSAKSLLLTLWTQTQIANQADVLMVNDFAVMPVSSSLISLSCIWYNVYICLHVFSEFCIRSESINCLIIQLNVYRHCFVFINSAFPSVNKVFVE